MRCNPLTTLMIPGVKYRGIPPVHCRGFIAHSPSWIKDNRIITSSIMSGPSTDEAARHAGLLSSATSQIPWYKQPHLLKLNFSVFSLILLSSAIGYDSSMTNGLLALPTWNAFMDYPTGAWLGFINCIYIIGILVTLPICPVVANKYGRKKGIWIGFAFLFLGVGLQAGAHNVTMFILGRCFLGMNTGWYTTASPLLITEIAYPPHRVSDS